MSAIETTSHVSTKTAQVRNRWIRNIEAAIKAGVPRHVRDGLETAIKQIRDSIKYGGKGHLQERIVLLEYELACASMMLWQPIETAPTGKHVLACNALGYVGRAILLKGKWEHIGKPTHWMPLPLPPRCEYCDDTGDVHSLDGEWRGLCTCPAGKNPTAL